MKPPRYRLLCQCAALLGLMLLPGTRPAVAAPVTTSRDAWAPFEIPWFDKVGIDEGLPHSVTTALAQDSRGLMWIGSMGGLVRYDGYRMQVFGLRTSHTNGLRDAYVRSLLALPDSSMLIGTNAGGLARFDPATDSFRSYPIGPGGTDRKIYALVSDHAGGVWIATDDGVDHLDLRSNTIRPVPTGDAASPRNFSVLQDRQGDLWLGNNNGLFVRRVGSRRFVRPATPDPLASAVLASQIWAIHEDAHGRLWVGSGQLGSVYRDRAGTWHAIPGYSGYHDGALQPTVRDFLDAGAGSVWIATDGGGIVAWTAGSSRVQVLRHDQAVASSLPGNSVRALLADRSGNLWAATDLGAANIDPAARTAFALLASPLEQNALSDTNVHSIFVDSRQRIWLGEGAGHIDLIDLANGTMEHLHLGGTQAQRDVQSFAETADGTIWVGTQGLASINPDTLAIHDGVLPALNNRPVLSLQRDGSQLLIGTYEGVFRYNTRTHTLENRRHVPGDPASLASDTVRQITRVGSDWWYSTTRGISISGDGNRRGDFENLSHVADDPSSLPQDYVGSMTRDSLGRLWVSTFGGLGVVDSMSPGNPPRFRTVGLQQGLASDKVNAVLADDHGRIWASISSGIAMIDSRSGAIANLGTRDGLHITSYFNIAATVAPGGDLLFGGLGGLTVIHPNLPAATTMPAPLVITAATINGDAIPFGKLPHDGQTLTLKRGMRNLRVDFSLLDYQAPTETGYSYRMDGLDQGWTDIPRGSLPSAIYTNLPHGAYLLQMRAATRGLHPHTIQSQLLIEVTPQWYETVLARLLAFALLLALIALLVHLRTRYLQRQAVRLQRRVDEQTQSLRAANQRLDELAGTDDLTGVCNRRRLLELAGSAWAEAGTGPLSIALLDLDHFKQINDTHGHQSGDAVLRAAATVIQQQCRQGDLFGRFGGEEFMLCLPDTPLSNAMEIAERIRSTLAQHRIIQDDQPIRVTACLGVATLRAGESIEQALSRADKALYEAKRSGRNRCAVAS